MNESATSTAATKYRMFCIKYVEHFVCYAFRVVSSDISKKTNNVVRILID